MTNSHTQLSADICDAAVDRAMTSFQQAVNSMVSCKRCNGTGYHHGFGEHGHDPDWCEVCGGCQSVPEFDDREAMRQAIKAAQSGAVAQAAWMPIETAPRDGTDIIVYRPKFDGDYITRVGTDYWMTKGVLTPTWARSRKDCPPTHWMHFPEPPK